MSNRSFISVHILTHKTLNRHVSVCMYYGNKWFLRKVCKRVYARICTILTCMATEQHTKKREYTWYFYRGYTLSQTANAKERESEATENPWKKLFLSPNKECEWNVSETERQKRQYIMLRCEKWARIRSDNTEKKKKKRSGWMTTVA